MQTNQGQQGQLALKQTSILYGNTIFATAGMSVSILVIFYIIRTKIPLSLAVYWLAITLTAVPIRFALYASFNRSVKKGLFNDIESANRQENLWIAATILLGISLASSAYLPYQEGDRLILLLFIGLVLVSMVTGSIVSSITSIKTVLIFIHLTIIPFTLRCFMESGSYFWTLGSFFIAFYIIFCSLTLKMSTTVINSLKQQIEGQEMADKDSLTGLWNRRKLFSFIAELQNQPYCLLLIDVDHFKLFNDKYGHSKGDEMLSDISLSISHAVGKTDLVVRYGGEEFLVICPSTSLRNAVALAERIRMRVKLQNSSSISIGVADSRQEKDFDALVERADKAMYLAKKDGRDCVRCLPRTA